MRVAIVGATGAVGQKISEILVQRDFPCSQPPALFASERSAGELTPSGPLLSLQAELAAGALGYDLALFSAGAAVSREWAPRFAAAGAIVVDNSSAWRADPDVPLVVAEVNPQAVAQRPRGIIANPNCVAMGALVALAPLHREFGLRGFASVSFQAAGGAGQRGIEELLGEVWPAMGRVQSLIDAGARAATELERERPPEAHHRALAFNVIPHLGELQSGEFSSTDEEEKMLTESRKILDLPELWVSPTCVRVPTLVGHGIQIRAEFEQRVTPADAELELAAAAGVEVQLAPTPLDAAGRDEVLVGRIRPDHDLRALNLWVVSDNLRKGAATNTVQIAELVATELLT